MVRDPREHPPTGSGPGRGTPRSRTAARQAHRAQNQPARQASAAAPASQRPEEPAEQAPASGRGLRLTRLALTVLVVVAILVLSYASTLRVYLNQRHQIAEHEASIAQRQQQINDLQQNIDRWNDDSYVKTQAQARLGWVMPGEVGYKVIGPDGKVIGAAGGLDTTAAKVAGEHSTTWWERLERSVAAADDAPTPGATPSTAKPQVITESSSPKPAASASSTGR